MKARMWHGRVPTDKAEAYHQFLLETGIKDYSAIDGNRGVFLLKQTEGDITHFYTLTFWETIDAIIQFAGEDYARAKYYPEDKDFLLEFEPYVSHFDVIEKSDYL